MKCLYTSRNNSFNHPIFQSKLIELLSRNNKNKKKITMESISFRQKLSTSKLSHTNSYINSNTNTNTNSLIKQSGNNTKRKVSSKTKININNMNKFSMSNDNFNEYNKKVRNYDIINTIYTTKKNSRSKNNNITNTNNNKKRSKSKNNNCIKNEKSSKIKKNKKMSFNNNIMKSLENDLSLKKENQILKLKLIELQNEIEKLKNENGLLISQNRNQNSSLSKKKEKSDISIEKKTKKINKLNHNLNLRIDNFDNNYPSDYFNIIYNNNYKSTSPIHDYIHSNKKIFNNIIKGRNKLSYNTSKNNINFEQSGNYFTIGNIDKIKTNNSNNTSKILNTSKNKILLSMNNINKLKSRLNKSTSRVITPVDKSYNNNGIILNTEKFIKNLKKNKIKEKILSQHLIYTTNNITKNEGNNILRDNINDKIMKIALKKGNSSNLFKFNTKNNSLSNKENAQDKIKLKIKDNIKNIIIKKIDSNKSNLKSKKIENINNKGKEFNNLKSKMENIYQRSKNLLSNYDKFIEANINLNK